MADATTDVEIRIRATGGPEAADGISKARTAVDNLAKGGDEISDKFGKKLSLIGLTTLNYELLRSIDYGGKAKPVISALNMAWFSFASTIGLTNSALFPYVAGITAVIAIIAKIKGGQDELTMAMSEAQKVTVKMSMTYEEARIGLENYIKVHGSAPEAFKEYVKALADVEKAERQASENRLKNEISTLMRVDIELKKQIETLKANNAEMKKAISENENFNLTINKTEVGVRDANVEIGKLNESNNKLYKEGLSENSKKLAELDSKMKENTATMKRAQTELDGLKGGFSELTKAAEKDIEVRKKHNEQLDKLIKNMREEMIKAEKDITAAKAAALNERFALEKSIMGSMVTENEVTYARIKDYAKSAYLEMASGFGNSVARVLVDGESLKENMDKVFKNILRSFISMIVEMQLRSLAIRTLMGFGFGVPAFATGTNQMVDRPTLFMAGENGPERVKVSPMNTAHNDNRVTRNISVNVVNNISSGQAENTRRLADQIGAQVISRIRGLGDMDFTRS